MPHNPTFVVIDDHPFILTATKHMLNVCSPSTHVVTYLNPETFILDIKAGVLENPSLILCDYNMPEMSGLEVHNALKTLINKGSSYFYLISSEEKLESLSSAFKSDFFSGCYEKPLSFKTLEELVSDALVSLHS